MKLGLSILLAVFGLIFVTAGAFADCKALPDYATLQKALHGEARNVAASLGYGKRKEYKHRNMGLVVDLGPHYAVANPLNVHLSGFPAKVVTRSYHLYALPRALNRWSVSLAYLTDALFNRSVVSLGLSSGEDAQLAASEGIPMPKTG